MAKQPCEWQLQAQQALLHSALSATLCFECYHARYLQHLASFQRSLSIRQALIKQSPALIKQGSLARKRALLSGEHNLHVDASALHCAGCLRSCVDIPSLMVRGVSTRPILTGTDMVETTNTLRLSSDTIWSSWTCALALWMWRSSSARATKGAPASRLTFSSAIVHTDNRSVCNQPQTLHLHTGHQLAISDTGGAARKPGASGSD